MLRVFRTMEFWMAFVISFVITGLLFLWELNELSPWLRGPPRPSASPVELSFSALTAFLIALNMGLLNWRRKHGSCPRGIVRATGVAGFIGIVALLCPICLALPTTLAGISVALSVFAAFLPALRVVAVILLLIALALLWPRRGR